MRAVQPKKLRVASFRPYGCALLKPERPLDIESPTLRYWHDMVDLSNLGQMGTMGFMQMKRVPVACETADFALGLRNTVILRTATGLTVDEKEITYATLTVPVTIAI